MTDISAVKDLFTKAMACPSNVAVNQLVYLSASDTVAKASAAASGTKNFLGFVVQKPTTTTCIVQVAGEIDTLSGLTAGTVYYLSDTAGAYSSSPGTNSVTVGYGLDSTTMMMVPGGVGLGASSGGGGANPWTFGTGTTNSAKLDLGGNTASGKFAVAEGYKTVASGEYSHAEGYGSISSGYETHAEGNYTQATVQDAHAEGAGTYATARAAHSEGIATSASGFASHAEGSNATASGTVSHAEGAHTVAYGAYSHAEGQFCKAYGYASHAECQSSISWGQESHAENVGTTVGRWSHSENQSYSIGINSHAEGIGTYTGYRPYNCTISGTTVTISGNHTAQFPSNGSVTLFRLTGGTSPIKVVTRSITAGPTFGGGNTTFTINSAVGDRTAGKAASQKFGEYAHVEGRNGYAIGKTSHAEGYGGHAIGYASHVEGGGNKTYGDYCHAEGAYTISRGYHAHSEGHQTEAYGLASHAEGSYSWSSGTYSHAGGKFSVADKFAQFARGSGALVGNGDSQFSDLTMFGTTTNATATELFLDKASARCTIKNNQTWAFVVTAVAHQKSSEGSASARFIRSGMLQDTGGTVALVGTVQTIGTDIGSNAGAPPVGWAIAATADDTNKSLKIAVTGAAVTTILWVVKIELVEALYA